MKTRPTNWDLSSDSWQRLAEVLEATGLSWSRVDLNVMAAASVPHQAGVYLVCGKPPLSVGEGVLGKLYNVLYVGKATQLRNRFRAHCVGPSDEMARARLVYYDLDFWYATTEYTFDCERAIYAAFGPPVNKIAPPKFGATLSSLRPV